MATYYRWNQRVISYTDSTQNITLSYPNTITLSTNGYYYPLQNKPSIVNGHYDFSEATATQAPSPESSSVHSFNGNFVAGNQSPTEIYTTSMATPCVVNDNGDACIALRRSGLTATIVKYTARATGGTFTAYVYSANPSAYPNGGISGN